MSNLNDQLCGIIEETINALQKMMIALEESSDANENLVKLTTLVEEDENKSEVEIDIKSKLHEASEASDDK